MWQAGAGLIDTMKEHQWLAQDVTAKSFDGVQNSVCNSQKSL